MKNFENEKILVTGHTGFKGSWLYIIDEIHDPNEQDNLCLNHFDFDWKIL